MSTQPAHTHEALSAIVAKRLRGKLAEEMISGAKLASMTGIPQSTVSRKLLGGTPFTLDEIDLICTVTGISPAYILLGKEESAPGPRGPGGLTSSRRPAKARSLDYKADDSGVLRFPSLGDDGQLPYIPLRTVEAPAAAAHELRPAPRMAA